MHESESDVRPPISQNSETARSRVRERRKESISSQLHGWLLSDGGVTAMLSAKEKIAYGLGDAASNIVFQSTMLFLAAYYTDVVGISAGIVGSIFLGVRILDAFTDPIMGRIADRTHTRWGSFRPYLLWVSVPYGVATVLVFTPFDLTASNQILYAVVSYSGLMVFYTAINIPYSALGGVITADPAERVDVQGYRFSMAWCGGLLVALFMVPMTKYLGAGDDGVGYSRAMTILSLIAVAMFVLCFLGTRERVVLEQKPDADLKRNLRTIFRNDQLWVVCGTQIVLLTGTVGRGTVTVYFANHVLGLKDSTLLVTAFVAIGLVGNVVGGILSARLERRVEKSIAVPRIQLIVAAMCLITLATPTNLVMLHFALSFGLGICSALAVPMVWAMVTDTVDYGAVKSGERLPGLTFAANLFSIKMGFALGGALAGWLLYAFSYDGASDVKTTTAKWGIALSFSVLPAIGSLATLAILRFYRLSKSEVHRMARTLEAQEEVHTPYEIGLKSA